MIMDAVFAYGKDKDTARIQQRCIKVRHPPG